MSTYLENKLTEEAICSILLDLERAKLSKEEAIICLLQYVQGHQMVPQDGLALVAKAIEEVLRT